MLFNKLDDLAQLVAYTTVVLSEFILTGSSEEAGCLCDPPEGAASHPGRAQQGGGGGQGRRQENTHRSGGELEPGICFFSCSIISISRRC